MKDRTEKPISIRLDADLYSRLKAMQTKLSPPLELTVSQVMRSLLLRALDAVETPPEKSEFKRGQDDMRERISRRVYGIYRSACEADSQMCWPGDLKLIAEGLDRGFVDDL